MVSRRHFVGGVAAATVLGFNPITRSWVSQAAALPASLSDVPHLEGELVTDPSVLAEKASDVGNLFERTPMAVLRPASAEDIAKMIRFCRHHDIFVAGRGQGHTTHGQSLVQGGLSIDMSSLNRIHSIGSDHAVVDAGVMWRDLLPATFERGLTPPVLTGYLGLSVGGTLSVGGISGGNARGAQVDRVRMLEVVTGEGRIVRCSAWRHRSLFMSVLAGLGQCGVITKAVVDLVPALPMTRKYLIPYIDNATFFADLRTLLDRNEIDDVYNMWFPDGAGGWLYMLNAIKYFDPSDPPDDAHLLRGLNFHPPQLTTEDKPYLDYAFMVDGIINQFRQAGLWDDVLHPWFDVFLPDSAVESYLGEVIPTLTPEDVGPAGFMLLFPQKRSELTRPLLRVPDDGWVYLFDILTSAPAPGPNPDFAERMLSRNRRLFERARSVGGTRYPIGSLEFDARDWVRHYRETYFAFAVMKRRYDPDGILTPGPGIFSHH